MAREVQRQAKWSWGDWLFSQLALRWLRRLRQTRAQVASVPCGVFEQTLAEVRAAEKRVFGDPSTGVAAASVATPPA